MSLRSSRRGQYIDSHPYSLVGGIDPHKSLSVTLDVGTNNESLLNDELYVVCPTKLPSAACETNLTAQGWPHGRVRGEEYDKFIDKFEFSSLLGCNMLT